MQLTKDDKFEASMAMCRGGTFEREGVVLSKLNGEYCVQRTTGPMSYKNRVTTHDWDDALTLFERFTGLKPILSEYSVRIVMSELTIIAESAERAEEIAMEIYEGDARTHLDHSLFVEACEVDDRGPSDEDEETEV